MNNPVNAYAALPVYRRIQEQANFRHGGPALLAPTGQLLPFQFQTTANTSAVEGVFMERDGRFAIALDPAAFERHVIDGDGYRYTFTGAYLGEGIPECEGYVSVTVRGNTIYTEMMRLQFLNYGQTVTVTQSQAGRVLTLTSSKLTFLAATADRWEYYDEGWQPLPQPTGDTTTFDVYDVYNGTADTVVRIRRTIEAGTRVYTGLYGLSLRRAFSNNWAKLIELPQPTNEYSDVYCFEYWNSGDAFGFLYEEGFRQRVYLTGTFDGPVVDEQDNVGSTPTGVDYLYSSIVKPRQQFAFNGLPDFMVGPMEGAVRHDNMTLTRMSDGVTFTMKEAAFEYAQGADPLSVDGRLSFVQSIFYLSGVPQSLNSTNAPPVRDNTIPDRPDETVTIDDEPSLEPE